MLQLPITVTFAAFLLLIAVPLSLQVTMQRIKLGNVVFGDADDPLLRRRVRAHANFSEYAPFAIVAVGMLELSGALSSWAIGLVAVALVGARLLHAAGMLYRRLPLAMHGQRPYTKVDQGDAVAQTNVRLPPEQPDSLGH